MIPNTRCICSGYFLEERKCTMPRTPEKRNALAMTRVALFVALLSASSYLVIPLPFTPVVLSVHTLMVNLIALALSPAEAACSVGVYLVMGLVGLPVFSGGTAGPGKLFGPTGGFYFGFFFGALAISLLKGKKLRPWRWGLVTIAVGLPIQHFWAVLFMCLHNGFDVKAAALAVSAPFLVGDVAKCILACVIALPLNRALQNNRYR